MTAPNKVDTRLLRYVAALLTRADAEAHAFRLDPVFRAIRQASGRLDLLRNIEAIASVRSRLISRGKHLTGWHPATQDLAIIGSRNFAGRISANKGGQLIAFRKF
jgi:hypothetical protein